MRRFGILLLCTFLVTTYAASQTSIEDELLASVFGIEGKTHLDRGEFIKHQLRSLGIGYVSAPFTNLVIKNGDTIKTSGENIIVRLGAGSKRIVVGAHYDAFSDSPGANDNGSGVAVLLSLIKDLQNIDWNYTVDFCFFDLEESGCLGSLYYIKQFVIPQHHLAMINLDIEGTGEEVYVGPVGNNNRKIIRSVNDAAKATGVSLYATADYPGSDQQSFAASNLENISISVVPRGDGEKLSKFVHNGYQADSIDMPEVLKPMHTFEDRSRIISPASLKISFEFTRQLLLLINESGR